MQNYLVQSPGGRIFMATDGLLSMYSLDGTPYRKPDISTWRKGRQVSSLFAWQAENKQEFDSR